MFKLRRLINGIILSTITLVISLWITASAFEKNSYYLAQLLPLFMAIYLLLAWLIYLRQDKASLGPRYKPHVQVLGHHEAHLAKAPEDQHIPVDTILDNNSLKHTATEETTEERDPFWEDSLYTLLWSACILGLLATVLYWFFQIGSRINPL